MAFGLDVAVEDGNTSIVGVLVGLGVNVGVMTAAAAPGAGVLDAWICSGVFTEQAARNRKRGMRNLRIYTRRL